MSRIATARRGSSRSLRHRLTTTIVAVTALTIVLLGVPLAIVVQRSYLESATLRLQRLATEGLTEVAVPLDQTQLDRLAAEADSPRLSVYDASGVRRYGDGPSQRDLAVDEALAGDSVTHHDEVELVVALPINERGSERVLGVIRTRQPMSVVDGRVHRAWAVMTLAALAALAIAWLVATALARQLAKPVQRLATAAAGFGDGGVVGASEHTGIAELDQLDDALVASSARLAMLVSRERAFSADVSHQLRTPLTRLRISLESGDGSGQTTSEALLEVDRLQATVEHLLALSRDRHPIGEAISVSDAVVAAARRWTARVDSSGRDLRIVAPDGLPPIHGSRTAVDQILDVLVDNAVVHGAGTIGVIARSTPGGVVVDVNDDGTGVDMARRDWIFQRHHGTGNGIGLALARSLAEAEGGRLLLAEASPPRFSLIFPR